METTDTELGIGQHESMILDEPLAVHSDLSSASGASTPRSTVKSDNYSERPELDLHREMQMSPLSIPLFTGQYSTSKTDESIEVNAAGISEDVHFNYDEQLAETLEESDADSSSVILDPELGSMHHNSIFSRNPDPFSIYDGLFSPRRSSREHRLPTKFEPPLPRESPTLPRKPGRPPRSLPQRGRGRPRKYPLPGDSTPTTEPNYASHSNFTTSYTSSPNNSLMDTSIKSPNSQTEFESPSTLSPNSGPLPPRLESSTYSPAENPSASRFTPTTNLSNPTTMPTNSPSSRRTLLPRAAAPVPTSKTANHTLNTSKAFSTPYEAQGTTKWTPKSKRKFPVLSQFTGPASTWFTQSMVQSNANANKGTPNAPQNAQTHNNYTTPLSQLKYLMQPHQVLECRSGVMSIALSPCGTLLACGTLLGQIFLFAAEFPSLQPASEANSEPRGSEKKEWHQVKWTQVAILQDFSEEHVDRFWNIIWAPDSTAIIAAGSRNARHQYDPADEDLKVLPCPLVVFDLNSFVDSPNSSKSIDTEAKQGIRRFEGHFEEVVDMKLWEIGKPEVSASGVPSYLLVTCSQDGHVRRWKFDRHWRHLESVLMKDEETWMAFCAAHLELPVLIPPSSDNSSMGTTLGSKTEHVENYENSDASAVANVVMPTSLFLLAGDNTLKLFDGFTSMKLFTFGDLYETYCTSVEVFRTPHSIRHPWRENTYLNGDGCVYRDASCSQRDVNEPPTFLILTKGIDFIAANPKRDSARKSNNGDGSDREFGDDEYSTRKTTPTRILLHVLTLPMSYSKTSMPTTRGGVRKTEVTHKYAVQLDGIHLETISSYSHPLFHSNYWPSRITHNGRHVLSAASEGTVFAWNILTSLKSPPSAASFDGSSRKPLNASPSIASILASHDEELSVRDVAFHPDWPFLFTAGDDGSVHVWAPSLFDAVRSCSVPVQTAIQDPPSGANLSSAIVPRGASAAYSQQIAINHHFAKESSAAQYGSVYKSAIEAAMLATAGSVMTVPAKRRRGRPPKKKLIEEIEAQFAAQERALAAQEQVQIINPSHSSTAAESDLTHNQESTMAFSSSPMLGMEQTEVETHYNGIHVEPTPMDAAPTAPFTTTPTGTRVQPTDVQATYYPDHMETN